MANWNDEDRALHGDNPEWLARPMLRTHYPQDTTESEDIVGLDGDGEIVVLDSGID